MFTVYWCHPPGRAVRLLCVLCELCVRIKKLSVRTCLASAVRKEFKEIKELKDVKDMFRSTLIAFVRLGAFVAALPPLSTLSERFSQSEFYIRFVLGES